MFAAEPLLMNPSWTYKDNIGLNYLLLNKLVTYRNISVIHPCVGGVLDSWVKLGNALIEDLAITSLPKVVLGVFDGHVEFSVFPNGTIVFVKSLIESISLH